MVYFSIILLFIVKVSGTDGSRFRTFSWIRVRCVIRFNLGRVGLVTFGMLARF